MNSTTSNSQSHIGLLMFIVLGSIGALTPLAIDMYLPAMPNIAKDFGVTSGAVQVTLTVYTAGFAIGQLIHGPLADSYGRRPVMIVGTLLFMLAAMTCATAESVLELTFVRAAQGFAGAAAAVVIQAVVRDMFDREDFARAMSFVTLVVTLAPLLAPMLGGHLAVWFGWRSVFWVLTLFSVLVIALVLWKIPETLQPENRQPVHLMGTLRHYKTLLTNPQAMGLILSGAFSFSGMFAFLTAGSFVYIDLFHVTPNDFGYLFGLNIVALIIFTLVNSRLVKKVGSHAMLRFGLLVQLIAGIGLFVGWWLNLGLWGMVPFVMMFIGTISTIGSNSMGLLLSGYPHMAGTASSLAGTLRFGVGSLVGTLVAALPGGVQWPMIVVMSACSVLSGGFYWLFGRKA
ncbi:Bcr/CflA family multidrug efflux MFS transporter [Vibrio zhugei]|uniref:Bcr/CflA family efflux transporter n=1 Tax=Vibrio zhugei TaxID=2479546 RepID=A0ABV7C866_9VIBR|nr:Bcr/CflA family multidrug efflux MFS transporter [Vibrio zhugei]